jgi:hypothetical protein
VALLYLLAGIALGAFAYLGLDPIAPRWLALLCAFWAGGMTVMLGLVRHSVLYSDENEENGRVIELVRNRDEPAGEQSNPPDRSDPGGAHNVEDEGRQPERWTKGARRWK